MFYVTTLSVIALVLIHLNLSRVIIVLRRRYKVGVGTGKNAELATAMRTQANNFEYSIWFIPLLYLAEVHYGFSWVLAILGALFVLARISYAYFFIQTEGGASSSRVYTTATTMIVLLALCVINLAKIAGL